MDPHHFGFLDSDPQKNADPRIRIQGVKYLPKTAKTKKFKGQYYFFFKNCKHAAKVVQPMNIVQLLVFWKCENLLILDQKPSIFGWLANFRYNVRFLPITYLIFNRFLWFLHFLIQFLKRIFWYPYQHILKYFFAWFTIYKSVMRCMN